MSKPTRRKSSFSAPNSDCVELADLGDDARGLSDSKLGDDSPVLHLSRGALAAFIRGAKDGEFDDLA